MESTKIFSSDVHNDFKSDFGFDAPKRTSKKCSLPAFADHNLHRIALMKDFHAGHKGDKDENGVPGWVVKPVCTGCGKTFKKRIFIID